MSSSQAIPYQLGSRSNAATALCLDVSPDAVSLCELDMENSEALFLASYQSRHDLSPVQLVADALKHTQVQLKPYKHTLLNFSGRPFTLVPTAFFEEDQARTLLEFNTGSTGNDVIQWDEINSDIRLIYSIPEELKSFFDKSFPNHQLRHTASIVVKLLLQSDELAHDDLLIYIAPGSVYLAVKKGDRLLLCNQYQAHTDEDILYYVLFALEQFELNPQTVKAGIAGNVEVESPLGQSFKTYLKHARFAGGSRLLKRAAISSLPHHFYFTTLNRVFCE